MSIVKKEDGKKWINAFVALIAMITGYIVIKFLGQMSEWFDLEAKISNFLMVSQGVGIATGLLTFIFILKNANAYEHMNEVYSELLKVVWPDKDTIVKVTIGIIIAVSIISGVFVGVDYVVNFILNLLY